MSNLEVPAIIYTPITQAQSMLTSLNNDMASQASLEEELTTGYQVNQASDNPALASTILQLNDSLARANQYSTNAADGQGWLGLANTTVNSVLSDLQTAQTTLQALTTDETTGQGGAVSGALTQIQSVWSEVLELANTTYGDQAIFAGSGDASSAYGSNGSYLGNQSIPTTTVGPGVTVQKSILGTSIFGPEADPANTGTNALNPNEITTNLLGPNGILQTVMSDLKNASSPPAGTTAQQWITDAATNQLGYLQKATANVESQGAVLGASYQRMETFATQATNTQSAIQTQISDDDDVNVAVASTQLTEAQNTYQSGLWATSQIEQHSLVEYLQ